MTKALMAESIRTLVDSEARFPITARFFKFGPTIIPTLEDLLSQPIADDSRNHAAALLLELGSKAGVPHLLSILEDNRESSPMGAFLVKLAFGRPHCLYAGSLRSGIARPIRTRPQRL